MLEKGHDKNDIDKIPKNEKYGKGQYKKILKIIIVFVFLIIFIAIPYIFYKFFNS